MNTKLVFTFFSLLFAYTTILANNAQVSGVTRIGANRDRVQFELSWENSWNFTNIPSNHDAVWVFIKYRECGVGGNWHHALLSTTMSEHTLPATLAAARPITTTDRLGNPGAHNTGILIRRATIGHGNIVPQTVTLAISGASDGIILDNTKEYDIKVFAIEMVQVLQGAFYAGDGVSSMALHQQGTGYNTSLGYSPLELTSEIATDVIRYGYYDYVLTLKDSFPKGVNEFYCMKYEITQGQYCDFLNTISATQALNRYYSFNYNYGYNIWLAGKYMTNRADRATFMSFIDLMAYLDWAALRPMTELEYEKACRGTKEFIPGEYAWGNISIIEAVHISGTVSGQEICTDSAANLNYLGQNYFIYGGIWGGTSDYAPALEVGIFARDNTLSREATGGTYYGAMEMSGNVWEHCIQVNTNLGNPSPCCQYTGVWGDGQLSTTGFANVYKWNSNPYYISRGGCSDNYSERCRVSDRDFWLRTNYESRDYRGGGRGVR